PDPPRSLPATVALGGQRRGYHRLQSAHRSLRLATTSHFRVDPLLVYDMGRACTTLCWRWVPCNDPGQPAIVVAQANPAWASRSADPSEGTLPRAAFRLSG